MLILYKSQRWKFGVEFPSIMLKKIATAVSLRISSSVSRASNSKLAALVLAAGVLEPLPDFDPARLMGEILRDQSVCRVRLAGIDQRYCRQDQAEQGVCGKPLDASAPAARTLFKARRLILREKGAFEWSNLHAKALYKVAWGELDEGRRLLELAKVAAPTNPTILSDYAAVLAEIAQQSGNALAYFEALEASLEATSSKSAPPEAYFNQAKIETDLNLPGAANAWLEYLERDPDSLWSDEARESIRKLSKPPETPDLEPLRKRCFELLAKISEFEVEPRRLAIEELKNSAAQLAASTGDSLLAKSVALLTASSSSLSLEGHALFGQGFQAYSSGDNGRAFSLLSAAEDRFHRASDPMESYASFYLAAAEYMTLHSEESLERIVKLRGYLENTEYWHIRAYVDWLRAGNLVNLGRPVEALEPYLDAREFFEKAKSPENEAALFSLAGECSIQLGQSGAAWKYFQQALQLRAALKLPKRVSAVFQSMANAAHEQQLLKTAELLTDVLVTNNQKVRDPLILFLSLVSRAWIHFDQRDLVKAKQDLEIAREQQGRLTDSASKSRGTADLAVLEAALAENPTPAQFAQIDASIAEYVERNYRTFVHAQALTVRSDAKLREGNPLGAAEDLDKSLEIYEGALVDDTRSRWSLRQSATQLYDRWTRIELDLLNSPAAAFEVAERAKEFSFFSFDFHASRLAKTRRVLSLEELRSTLPAEWQVLSYRILGNQLLTWKISKLDVAFTSKEFSRHELQAKIAEVRSKARSRKRLPAATSNYLSELLIGTIPANCSLLVIIPDQELNDLPFSLLNSGSSPLVDRIAVLVAPSAGTLAEARQRIVAAPTSNNVLVVSDPVVDKAIQHEFSLGELKSAGLEGIQVAAFYPGARHLAGPQATPENLYSRPFDYKLLHFASHAILDSKNPESSFLVLTSGRTGSSQLFQRDLYALKLTSAPLVVLSACETGRLTGAAGEGLSSLARAFLSAGASAVLATMWAVQDGSAAFMATAFHREFSAGVPAAEALRRAQAAYRRDSKLLLADPLGWSAFQLVGASR